MLYIWLIPKTCLKFRKILLLLLLYFKVSAKSQFCSRLQYNLKPVFLYTSSVAKRVEGRFNPVNFIGVTIQSDILYQLQKNKWNTIFNVKNSGKIAGTQGPPRPSSLGIILASYVSQLIIINFLNIRNILNKCTGTMLNDFLIILH